jgi:hypothetical protein
MRQLTGHKYARGVAVAVLIIVLVVLVWHRVQDSVSAPELAVRDQGIKTIAEPGIDPLAIKPALGDVPAIESSASISPFFPIWASAEAGDVLRGSDQLERILTPTSKEDELWMLSYAYPRPKDYRTRSISELERAFSEAGNDGRPLGKSSRDYAANALAAAKWEANDPSWADWARRSQSPFAQALLAADAMQRFRKEPSSSEVRLELQRAISGAFARGERALAIDYLAEASMYGAFTRAPNSSLIDLFSGFAEIDSFNRRSGSAGVARPPMAFEPRPAPSWSIYGQRVSEGGGG